MSSIYLQAYTLNLLTQTVIEILQLLNLLAQWQFLQQSISLN
jgi:hypothetical protein